MNTNELPPLSPPYGELPPTFWEQHGTSMMLVGLGVIVLMAFGLWLIFRPRQKIITPPEMLTRQELERLRQLPEDGAVLSRVSQVVRNYFITAFKLSPGEFTTAEFSRAISSHEQSSTELSAAVDLLRDCDARKFSALAASTPLNAASRALKLIEQAELRRMQLQQLAETQNQGR